MRVSNLLSNLGLCRRAGKLEAGFDSVKQAVVNRLALLILYTEDLSDKTKKEILFLAGKYQIEAVLVPLTMDQVAQMLRKKIGVFAITDQGFVTMLKKSLANLSDDQPQSEQSN